MQAEIGVASIGTRNPIWRDCSDGTRAFLMARGRLQVFQPGDVLLREGQPGGIVYLPLEGMLQLSKTSENRRRQVLCYVDPECCAPVCLLMMADRCLADVIAIEPGQILTLGRDDLAELAVSDPVVGRQAWRSASLCLSHFVGMVENLSFHKVAERVTLALLQNTGDQRGTVRRTQAELAAEVGTTREVVARCLAELQGSGLIKLGRGRITVLDRCALERA